MMLTLVFASIAGQVFAASLVAQCPSPTPERFDGVTRQLTTAITSQTVGSVVGLIARDDSILYCAFGEIGKGVPMPTDAIMRVASITKPVTAVAVLLLVEEGRLALSDRVDRWYPGFGSTVQDGDSLVSASRPVTVRDLLTHQAGLAVGGPKYDSLFDATTADEYARGIGAIPLRFHPGTRFEYGCCGSAYEVLGAIVEKVAGQSYRDFLQARVLAPLKMRDTYFNVPSDKRPRLAGVYRKNAAGTLAFARTQGQEEPEGAFYSAAGGLRSTVTDYQRFGRFLLNGGELDGVRLLSRETIHAMTTNQVGGTYPEAGFGWGYGLRIRTVATTEGSGGNDSYGWNGGTGTLFLVDPQRRLIFVIMAPVQPGTPGVSRLRNSFVAAGYEALSR